MPDGSGSAPAPRAARPASTSSSISKRSRVQPGKLAALSEIHALAEVADDTSPLLVDFYADWCVPCHGMDVDLHEAAKRLRGRVRVVKVDWDTATTFADQTRVLALPTVLAYRHGQIAYRHTGRLNADELEALAERYLLMDTA